MTNAVQIRLSEFTVRDYTDGAVKPGFTERLVSYVERGIETWHYDWCAVQIYQ